MAVCQFSPSYKHIKSLKWRKYIPDYNLFIYLELHIHIPKKKGNTFHLQTPVCFHGMEQSLAD